MISVAYYNMATGELDKTSQICDEWVQAYPRDCHPHVNLGLYYASISLYEKSIQEYVNELRIYPDSGGLNYESLMEAYSALGRLAEAKAVYDQAVARKLDGSLPPQLQIFGGIS